MKILLGISVFFAMTHLVPAHASLNQSFETDKIQLACGDSSDVWMYVTIAMGTRTASEKRPLPIADDEDTRYYIGYPDGSWIIGVEYYSRKMGKENFNCIVDKGTLNKLSDSILHPVVELPNSAITRFQPANQRRAEAKTLFEQI